MNTRKLTTMGILAGLSVALVFFIRFPIFPQAPFLEYDPADIPILIAAFVYGPIAGLLVTAVASVVQGLTVSSHSGAYGIIMHIISTGSFVLTAGIIYRLKHSRTGAGIAIVCGVLVSAAAMVAANLIITPIYMGVPVEAVKAMLAPVIIPFNLIKSGANGVIAFLLYKPISNLIKERGNARDIK
ncbi:MAG: ECF transporter S component [Defluviitaleaceae bacterium]|nr:ECF transporter S component [Defluviitaleaceae bacterium]